MSYLSTNHALFPPTLPPFGVTNSINERLFKKCIFSFLLILGCLKIKSQRLASSQQKFKRSQDTHKKIIQRTKILLIQELLLTVKP